MMYWFLCHYFKSQFFYLIFLPFGKRRDHFSPSKKKGNVNTKQSSKFIYLFPKEKQLGRPKMESLPDDVLHQILQIGLKARRLDHVNLCSLAIVNNHFDQLTQESALWGTLLSRDFPFYSFEAPSKEVYRRRQR